ncbi:related to transcriptional activator Mut3p [Cephalotrichum gorgonifer]|uniref:Related to transcriptional activator Mut3p n=1 Tax=Cephalotrichum gorgonifer TaxID=2041049 RepID=A0AAE8SX73_9PEZI|nr:related to transcriptional activator Mut3p [Cephalotrichum gorgonifer]
MIPSATGLLDSRSATIASPRRNSPTTPEASDDDPAPAPRQWDAQDEAHFNQDQDPASPSGSGKSLTDTDDKHHSGEGPSLPVQKRRRVTRACDECRRKKIKCDGKQPCTHCNVYSYDCTYDKPSNRRRNPAPQYIEALETRLQRAESMLRQFLPDIDLSDPSLDPAIKQEFRNRELARAQAGKLKQGQSGLEPGKEDGQIHSMIESIGQLDLDDKGGWDFHGASSGAVFLRRMREHFRGMMGPPEKAPFLPRPEKPAGIMQLDASPSGASSPFSSTSSVALDLPPKEEVRDLCYYSLNCATCLIRVVHVPSFYESLDSIYDKTWDSLTQEETHFLGLLYAVMAIGCMYRNLDPTKPEHVAYREALSDGMRYYNSAKSVLKDLAECRDLTSLQALVFMILFLQATSNLSSCYAFLGIALRSALRMGLHRHLEHHLISPIEQQVRRRVFYVVRQMDIYVSTLLGFPLVLHNEDVDQLYPTEIDDDYVRKDAILMPPAGTPSIFEAFNANTRLMEILAKIVKHVYPLHGIQPGTKSGSTKGGEMGTTYVISYARIKEIERDLHEWYARLPEYWRPSTDGPIEVVRVRHLLRFAYAHVQLVLYRPFLHYVSPRLSRGKDVDELSYACAAAAISVSRNIVHIGIEIRKQGVLIGPYWFMLYTEFFAVLSLVFYATENPQKNGTPEVLADAFAGRDMIFQLAEKSFAAKRVNKALDVLFNEIPNKMELPSHQAAASKKRHMLSKESGGGQPNAQRRSEELPMQRGMPVAGRQPPSSTSSARPSFDSVSLSGGSYSHQDSFPASLQDLLPMDMGSRTTPDSTSTGGGSLPHQQAYGNGNQATGSTPGLSKLDSLMFPSEDPFAYPNQPMMELGLQQKMQQEPMEGQEVRQDDATQYFMQGQFDDLESHLLGQIPPFMIEQSQQGMDIPGSIFANSGAGAGGPTGSVPSQRQGRAGSQGQAHGRVPVQMQGQGQHMDGERGRMEQIRRQQEQILAAQRYRADWGQYGGGNFHM